MLYLLLAERLNLPIYGVGVPNHFFVRYDDGQTRINIETMSKGKSCSDAYYIKRHKIPTRTHHSYLVNLNKRQTIGTFLSSFGCAYFKRNEPREVRYRYTGRDVALEVFQTAIHLNPNIAETHVNFGIACIMQGNRDAAIQALQTAIRINPNEVGAYISLGAIQINNQPEAAIAALETAVRINPNSAEVHANLGVAYQNQGKTKQAFTAYETALRLSPKLSGVHVNLGTLYIEQSEMEKAIKSLKTALRMNPNIAEAHLNLGLACQEQGNNEPAIAHFKAFICLAPTNPFLQGKIPEVQGWIQELEGSK